MSLDIHYMAHQAEGRLRDREFARVPAASHRHDRHPAVVRFGLAVSRLGHRLQGIPAPATPDFRPCPEPAAG